MEEGTILYLCTVAPLLYLLSDLLPPSTLPNVQYVTVCDCGDASTKHPLPVFVLAIKSSHKDFIPDKR